MYYRKPETELVSRKTRKKKLLEHARFSRVSSLSHYTKYICTGFFLSHRFILKLWFSQRKEWKSTTCYNGCVYKTLICAFPEVLTLSCFQTTGQGRYRDQRLFCTSASCPLCSDNSYSCLLYCYNTTGPPVTEVEWKNICKSCVSQYLPLRRTHGWTLQKGLDQHLK